MGGGVSTAAPFESVEAALAAGKTQEEIDAFIASGNNDVNKEEGGGGDADAGAAAADTDAVDAAAAASDGNNEGGGDADAKAGAAKKGDDDQPEKEAAAAAASTGGDGDGEGEGEGGAVEAVEHEEGGVDWGAMFAHKGDWEEQKERYGPAPDFANASEGWYWYGQDGSTGPELQVEGTDAKPAPSERPADVFYIHPTSFAGTTWNMPLR